MDFKLLRIILIDSYSRGKTVELKVDGHITINGKNGAGKTTLLRLFPIFLGESPSKVVHSDGVNDRFGKHYFPTTSSYVIYEYQRREQKVLAIIHADGQRDGVVYRFIDSEYRSELFRDEAGLIQSQDLARHLHKIGVFCSDRLSLAAYRQIIQNSSPAREYRGLATRFSFVGSGGRIDHIERVITGILQRVTTFYDLRRMVVSAVREDGQPFTLSTVKSDLVSWVHEFQAHKSMLDKKPVMEALEGHDRERIAIVAELSVLRAQFRVLHTYLQQEIQKSQDALGQIREGRDKLVADYTERGDAIQSVISQERSDHKSAASHVQTLDERKRQYAEQDIEASCALVDARSSLEAKRLLLDGQLKELDGVVSEIDKLYERLKADAKLVSAAEQQKLGDAKSPIWVEYNREQQTARDAFDASKVAAEEAHYAELASLRDEENTIRESISRLKERITNTTGDPELQSLLDAANTELTEAGQSLVAAHEQRKVLDQTYQKAKSAFDEGERQFNESELALEDAEGRYEKLLSLGNAGENTLLGFLRQHKPDWVASIGRVLQEDLLLRTDLVPELADGDTLYGVDLDLERISASRLSDAEQFQRDINQSLERLRQARLAVEEDTTALDALSVTLLAAQSAVKQHEIVLGQAGAAKVAAQNKVTSLSRQYSESKRLAQQEATLELGRQQDAQRQVAARMDSAKLSHQASSKDRLQRFDKQMKSFETERDQKLKAIEARQADIVKELADQLATLDRERDESLESKGISATGLQRLRSEIEDVDVKIGKAITAVDVVTQYRSWIDAEWSKRAEWQSAADRHEDVAKNQQRALDALMEVRKRELDGIDADITARERQIGSLREQAIYANNHQDSLSGWPMDPAAMQAAHDRANTLESLIQRKNAKMKSLLDTKSALYTGIEEICSVMRLCSNTRVEQHFHASTREMGMLSAERIEEWLEVCRDWYNHRSDENQASLQQLGRTQATNIDAFWISLDNFRKGVEKFHRELSSSLTQGRLFESIANVDVHITTDIDKRDYWPAMQRFHEEFAAWHPQSQSSLPPKELIEAAREVAAVLSEDRGLSADPADLLNIKVAADVNGKPVVAKNENELEHLSSNGLSYLVLSVVLVGFVNRIRREQKVVLPFPVDELKDLDFPNAKNLLELLGNNQINIISAFPDVDTELAPLFDRNYKVLEGRRLAIVKTGESSMQQKKEREVTHV